MFHAKRRDVPSETNALSDTLTSRLMRAWPVPGATGPRTRNRAFDPGSWHIVDAHVADGGGLGPVRNGVRSREQGMTFRARMEPPEPMRG